MACACEKTPQCAGFERLIAGLERPRWLVLSAAALVASFALMRSNWPPALDPALLAALLCGLPIVHEAWCALRARRIVSALLVTLGMVASLALGEAFAAGEIAFIMALGEALERRTLDRARRNLADLVSLQPEFARRILPTGGEARVSPADLRPGDLLRVLPGERISADGVLVEGHAAIDQSPLTGESLPIDRAPGDPLLCGTLNTFGSLTMRVSAAGEQTHLHRLVELLRQAEEHPAPIQRLADRWAARLVPAALAIALLGAAGAWILGCAPLEALRRGVTVLVVFCPCALVLATPTALVAAVGWAARRGILIRSGAALEALATVRDLALDKTGTLTRAQLRLTDCLCAPSAPSPDWLLARAASLEAHSEHPLARAITAAARERGLPLSPVSNFQALPGRGLRAVCEGTTHVCLSPRAAEEAGIVLPPPLADALAQCQRQGKATLVLAAGEAPTALGILALADAVRSEAASTLRALDALGIRTHLLSGDAPNAVSTLAQQLAIGHYQGGCLPEEKVRYLETLRAAGAPVAMLGDGLNDAPALKAATVGIAMGATATALTRQAADIALMNDRLDRLPALFTLARKTASTIRFNLAASLLINLVALILSLLGLLTPVSGALVHNLGSLLVVCSASRCRTDDRRWAIGGKRAARDG